MYTRRVSIVSFKHSLGLCCAFFIWEGCFDLDGIGTSALESQNPLRSAWLRSNRLWALILSTSLVPESFHIESKCFRQSPYTPPLLSYIKCLYSLLRKANWQLSRLNIRRRGAEDAGYAAQRHNVVLKECRQGPILHRHLSVFGHTTNGLEPSERASVNCWQIHLRSFQGYLLSRRI